MATYHSGKTRFIVCLLAICLIPSCCTCGLAGKASQFYGDLGDYIAYARVSGVSDFLALRAGPGTSYAELERLDNGTYFYIIEYSGSGKWAHVDASGNDGWVSTKYITVISDDKC